jgi:HEAT repeat protein
MAKQAKSQVPFKQIIAELLDQTRPFSPKHLHRFSDLNPADLASLHIAWPAVNVERRVLLLQDLEELADADTLVAFDELARLALDDPDARVRAIAIRLLWENEDPQQIPLFIHLMEKDPDETVRAGAATGLGLFVYLGELEALPAEKLRKVEAALLKVYQSADKPVVRQRALESLGYSGLEEVVSLVETAIASPDKDWQACALFAMGRSADERWENEIISRLEHPEPEIRLEAVRAAGLLSLDSARLPLLDILEAGDEEEAELRSTAIWSLSQIGGEQVRETLENLAEQTEDEDEADYLEEALDNLNFTEGVLGLGMIDLENLANPDNMIILDPEEEDDEPDDPIYGTKN